MKDFSFLNDAQFRFVSAARVDLTRIRGKNLRLRARITSHEELEWILEGGGCVISDGEIHPATPGTLFFRRRGVRVEGIRPFKSCLVCFDFLPSASASASASASTSASASASAFDPASAPVTASASADDPANCFPTVIHFRELAPMTAAFDRLYAESLDPDEDAPFVTRACLMGMLYLARREWRRHERFSFCGTETAAPADTCERVRQVAEYMAEHAAEDLTLETLVVLSGYGRSVFCQVFHDIMGAPPIAWLHRLRMRRVKQQLIESDRPVKAIMRENGYPENTHFSRLFKILEGISPTEFRASHRQWTTGHRGTGP